MTLSIIYINYNTRGLLKQSLKHLYLMKPALDFEIIVVDNNSKDGSAKMVRDFFPKVKLIEAKENLGYARGANAGFAAASGHYAAIFNPDIFISAGSLETIVNFLDANPGVALVGPKLTNPDGSLQYSCYRYPKVYTPIFRRSFLGNTFLGKKELDRYMMRDYDHEETRDVDWLLGGALVGRTSVLKSMGFFDERFFLYFEDTDLGRRLKESGHKSVYLPAAKMIHLHRRESADFTLLRSLLNKTTRVHIKSAIKYFLKYM
jgi:hypothetical protein